MIVHIVTALFLVAFAAEHSGTSESRTTLSFDQALGLSSEGVAIRSVRDAAAVKAKLNQQIARVNQNPTIQFQAGPRLLPEKNREPEIVLQILQPWTGGGYLQARRSSAMHEHSLLDARARAIALGQKLDVAHLWLQLATAQRELEVLHRMLSIAEALSLRIERTRQVGAAIEIDVREMQARTAEIAIQVVETEGTVHDLSLELSRRLGWSPTGHIETVGELPLAPVPGHAARDGYVQRAAALPEARASLMQAQANRAQAVEQKSQYGWSFAFGVNVERDAPGGLILSGIVQATPPLFEKGERYRGTTEAAAIEGAGHAVTASLAAQNAVALAFHEVEHSGELADLIATRLLPTAVQVWTLRRKQFELGGATVLDTLRSQQTMLAAELRHTSASTQHAWARVKLWLLLLAIEDGSASKDMR